MPIIDGGDPWGLPEPSPELGTNTGRILYLAAQQIQDITGTKWSALDVLLPYLNLAITAIIGLKPDAYTITGPITLVAGPTQSAPSGAWQIVDIVCNLASDGTTPAQVIRPLSKQKMDEMFPGWMTYTANAVVQFVMIDDRNPLVFYVFPPAASASQKVQAILTGEPDQIVAVDGEFPLDNSYLEACVDYVIYRALSEETTIPNALNKAKDFYNKFLQDLGLRSNAEHQVEEKGQ
jgi:hypothetical protein